MTVFYTTKPKTQQNTHTSVYVCVCTYTQFSSRHQARDHRTTSKDHCTTSKDHCTTSKDHCTTSKDHCTTSKDHCTTGRGVPLQVISGRWIGLILARLYHNYIDIGKTVLKQCFLWVWQLPVTYGTTIARLIMTFLRLPNTFAVAARLFLSWSETSLWSFSVVLLPETTRDWLWLAARFFRITSDFQSQVVVKLL